MHILFALRQFWQLPADGVSSGHLGCCFSLAAGCLQAAANCWIWKQQISASALLLRLVSLWQASGPPSCELCMTEQKLVPCRWEKEGWPRSMYGVSKLCCTAYMRLLAREPRFKDVPVTVCCPGYVDTGEVIMLITFDQLLPFDLPLPCSLLRLSVSSHSRHLCFCCSHSDTFVSAVAIPDTFVSAVQT